jgi:thioredoxin 1
MAVIHLNDSSFAKEVLESGLPVLVDFWAPWCGPCQMVAPIIDEIASEYDGRIKVAKINVDENPGKAAEYKIMSIPNMKIFKAGVVIEEIIGVVPKTEITQRLDRLLQ